MIWLLLVACTACRPEPPVTFLEREEAPAEPSTSAEPAGRVVDGRYIDGEVDFSIAVGPGWSARGGIAGDPVRLTMDHAGSGVQLRVIVRRDGVLRPEPRTDCDWSFEALGAFAALPDQDEVMAATCDSLRGGGPVLMAYLAARSGFIWQLELLLPRHDLADNKALGDQVLRTLRW